MEFKHGIRPRGDKFQFTVSNGFDGNGKQIRKYMTYRPPDGRILMKALIEKISSRCSAIPD